MSIESADVQKNQAASAIECDFPIIEISRVAEQESWRKEVNRPIYHIHKWWATRLGSVFRGIVLGALSQPTEDVWKCFYNKNDFSGKTVLDPFMGSGTTLGEAIKLGANAIGCDINPVSTFMVRQAFTRVSEKVLRDEYSNLEMKVASKIKHFYQTRDPHSNIQLPVLYYFWVKIVKTPTGEDIPLFSKYVFVQDAYPKKKPKSQILCPMCWNIFEGRYDATAVECPFCNHKYNPQIGPVKGQNVIGSDGVQYKVRDLVRASGRLPDHKMYAMLALRPDGEKTYLKPQDEDLALYVEAENELMRLNLPIPSFKVRPGHNTSQALGYNYKLWRDFFNSRQLLCLGILLEGIVEIDDIHVREQFLCLFSSTLEFNNMFCSFKGEGTGAVRHMFFHHILKPERAPLESSVWGNDKCSGTFSTLFESRLVKAKRYLDEPFEVDLRRVPSEKSKGAKKCVASNPISVKQVESWDDLSASNPGMLLLNGDSSQLPIPSACVDAVITDPPYFDFVHYSELSDFFFAWLSPVLQRHYPYFARLDSSAQGEVQHNDPRVFSKQLASVFSECHRVLKDNGVLAFSFHHSRSEGWAAIYEAISTSGFSVVAIHPVHSELRSASPKSAANSPISLDAILICRKRNQTSNTIFSYDRERINDEICSLASKLISAGMKLSFSDYIVIGSALMLKELSPYALGYDAAKNHIDIMIENCSCGIVNDMCFSAA